MGSNIQGSFISGITASTLLEGLGEFLYLIMPVLHAWSMSHLDDPEDFEQTRQDMIELINASADDERGREFLKALAHTLTERLSSKDLPLAERKIERELLDATLTVLRNEEPEPPRKKAVSG